VDHGSNGAHPSHKGQRTDNVGQWTCHYPKRGAASAGVERFS
jgi:hypothetical protein